jgi:hypothetical protein
MTRFATLAALLAAIGCGPPVYVQRTTPPPPRTVVVQPPPPRTVVVKPPPPDPSFQRADQLRREAQGKRIEAQRHHDGALALSRQATDEQAAADRDFADAKREGRDGYALMRDQRRVQAEMLWHRADRAERDAALLEGRVHDADADGAREDATARDEHAAAQRLRDAARREDDPGQRHRLEEEARALEDQARDDEADGQRARQAADPERAKIAQLRAQAQNDRAAATRIDPRIGEELDWRRGPVQGGYGGGMPAGDARRADEIRRRAAEKIASGHRHEEAAQALLARSQAEEQTADRLLGEARALDHERYALVRRPGGVDAEMLWLRASDEERRAGTLAETARGHRARAQHFVGVAKDERDAANRLGQAAASAPRRERDRFAAEAAAVADQAERDEAAARDEQRLAEQIEVQVRGLRAAAERDRKAALARDGRVREMMGG